MADRACDEEAWARIATIYEQFKPGLQLQAQKIIELVDAGWDLSSAEYILDIGCGPGTVVEVLLDEYSQRIPSSAKLHATDFHNAMIEQVTKLRDSKKSEPGSIWSRLELGTADVQELEGIPNDSVSHVTAGLVIFMVPEPRKALSAVKRVLTDSNGGGVLALSSWQRADWIDLTYLIEKVKPGKSNPVFPEAWRSSEGVKGELEATGYRDVQAFALDMTVAFDDHKTIVEFCADKLPHMKAVTSDMTAEELQKFKDLMLEEFKRMHPVAPGRMKGTNIIAFGRK